MVTYCAASGDEKFESLARQKLKTKQHCISSRQPPNCPSGSGRSVGWLSARGSGPRGREFKSHRPDHPSGFRPEMVQSPRNCATFHLHSPLTQKLISPQMAQISPIKNLIQARNQKLAPEETELTERGTSSRISLRLLRFFAAKKSPHFSSRVFSGQPFHNSVLSVFLL